MDANHSAVYSFCLVSLLIAACSSSNPSNPSKLNDQGSPFLPLTPALITTDVGGPQAPEIGENQLYDLTGNVVQYEDEGSTIQLAYNTNMQLVKQVVTTGSSTSSFVVYRNAFGKKIGTNSDDELISYGMHGRIRRKKNETVAEVQTYYGAIETQFAQEDGTPQWTGTDHLGSVVFQATSAKMEMLQGYLPYGQNHYQQAAEEPTDSNFTGLTEEGSSSTGHTFTDNNARHFPLGKGTKSHGAFTAVDTINPNPTTLAGMNPYAYANNNPTNFTDPSGHQGCPAEVCGTQESYSSGGSGGGYDYYVGGGQEASWYDWNGDGSWENSKYGWTNNPKLGGWTYNSTRARVETAGMDYNYWWALREKQGLNPKGSVNVGPITPVSYEDSKGIWRNWYTDEWDMDSMMGAANAGWIEYDAQEAWMAANGLSYTQVAATSLWDDLKYFLGGGLLVGEYDAGINSLYFTGTVREGFSTSQNIQFGFNFDGGGATPFLQGTFALGVAPNFDKVDATLTHESSATLTPSSISFQTAAVATLIFTADDIPGPVDLGPFVAGKEIQTSGGTGHAIEVGGRLDLGNAGSARLGVGARVYVEPKAVSRPALFRLNWYEIRRLVGLR